MLITVVILWSATHPLKAAAFRNDALPAVGGAAAFAALILFHQAVFGVTALRARRNTR